MTAIPSTGNLIDVYRLPSLTAQATPDAPFDISWRMENNGPGTGSFSIPLDDTAYGDIDINDVATIRADGRWFSFVIERIEERHLSPQEGGGKTATYMGRGVGMVLEWAPVTGSVPGNNHSPVEDDVVHDWRSLFYDPATYGDTWAAGTEVDSVSDARGDNAGSGSWPHFPMANNFDVDSGGLTPAAQMVDIAGSTTLTADPFWRVGYLDYTFTSGGRHAIELGMDNEGVFGIDGVEMYDQQADNGFISAGFQFFDVSINATGPATHRLWFKWFNNETAPGSGIGEGPAAVFFNFYKVDDHNEPLDGGLYMVSDDALQVMSVGADITDAPGLTVGDILLQHLAKSAAQHGVGTLQWLIPSFDVDDDSNGDPWPRISVSTKHGTPILQFIEELVAAGHISHWEVEPDGVTFNVFAPGYESDPGVTLSPAPALDPNSGQLTDLVVVRT